MAVDDEIDAFEEKPKQGSSLDFTRAEVLLLRGVALMVFVKLVMVGLIGLDPDARYVWPLTWVAFALMVPWITELIAEIKEDY